MDFNGSGSIDKQEFLESIIITEKCPFKEDKLQYFFNEQNIFYDDSEDSGINYDMFKKVFFPQHYMVQEQADDKEELVAQEAKKHMEPKKVKIRLRELEDKLKTKFSSCFESVRKAFLLLDTDYDGFITIEDILKYFGNEKDLNYDDLHKLMVDKDSKKQGRIGYPDFSKWLGSDIHMSEGFYFRHDSIKNPA